MTTNANITVYNRSYDPETRMDLYRRTVICGVWWHVDNKVSVTADGLRSADVFKVRIPEAADFGGAMYVPPNEYTGAPDTWTLQADDYIVRGALDQEIERPADLCKEHGQVFRITSWSDNRFGGLKHWRAGGE